jgi:hypothetical protein
VFTARYALSPYIKQVRFVFKGLIQNQAMRMIQGSIKSTLINSNTSHNIDRSMSKCYLES